MNIAIRHLSRKPLPISLPPFSSFAASSSSSSTSAVSSSSRKRKPPSMSDYLVKNLSFTKSEADAISSKHFSRLTSTAKPAAVLSFLRRTAHLSPSQLHRLVRLRPSLLLTNTRSTLHPKLTLFQSLLPPNPPPADLAALVSSCGSALGYSAARLSSSLSLLKSLLLGDDSKVVSAIRRYPRLLTNDPAKVLAHNADLLRSFGLSDKAQLAAFINKSPLALFLSPYRLSTAFSLVEREFNLNLDLPSSGGDFVNAVTLAAALTEEGFLTRIGMLRRFGFTNEELLVLFRRIPSFMRLKEEHMERKLEFFKGKVGMGPGEILRNGWMLMFSMDARLVPRHEIIEGLRERGLVEGEVDVRKAFTLKEDEFRKMFVERFKDGEGAELVKAYLRSSTAKKEKVVSSASSSSSDS